MFLPSYQRGGGERRGIGTTKVVMPIPIPEPVPFIGQGKHKVLLVQVKTDKPACTCMQAIPVARAPDVLSKMLWEPLDRVKAKLERAKQNFPERADLKTGEGEYIDSLVAVLSLLFCQEELVFSSEQTR